MTPAARPATAWKILCVAALSLVLAACVPIPVINVTPSRVVVGEEATFDGSETMVLATPEGTVAVKYRWDFGDGETAIGKEVTHTFTQVGTFRVTLTVTDSAGRTGSSTEPIQVLAPGEVPDSDDDDDDAAEATGDTAGSL